MPSAKMRKVHRYSNEFKITAVKLTDLPGTLIQDVAKALDIHPFMLSRWRKEYREGILKGKPHPDLHKLTEMEHKVSDQERIRNLEKALRKARLENDLLKKTMHFAMERRRMPSPLLRGIIKNTASPSSAGTSASPEAATTRGKKDR
ncbi:MAG TPA: transposase [Syntrophorhabdales bacterium]|nr:transposase [Syntrophorhabdales bacterium]